MRFLLTARFASQFRVCHRDECIHVLNAWSSANDFCVGQMKVDGKSNNEITAMPQLLKLMDVKGSVITTDALN